MALTNCIFCSKPLDGSDEHIIPDSLNGKLHSKGIICSTCNNKFGLSVDPIFKKILNPILIAFGFENANHAQVEGLEEAKYLLNKKGFVSPLRDEVTTKKVDNHTVLSVRGEAKSALKTLQKQAKKLTDKGFEFKGVITIKEAPEHNAFKIKDELNPSPELILALNKIATEYFAYCNLDTAPIKELLSRVISIDTTLDNVTFCNWNCDIREYSTVEITHLIILRRRDDGILYCYIELFNIICACIPLVENYADDINFIYHQNALTGEKLNREITFKTAFEFNNDKSGSFDVLVNSAFERHREIQFKEIYIEETKKIAETYKAEVKQGIIPAEKEGILEKRIGTMIAQLSLDFPYMIEDFQDELNDNLNYINSNLREDQYDGFCEKYKVFIQKDVKIDEELFKFNSFIKIPFLKRNDVTLCKVYISLINQKNGKQKFYPYFEFFRMIIEAYPESRLTEEEE